MVRGRSNFKLNLKDCKSKTPGSFEKKNGWPRWYGMAQALISALFGSFAAVITAMSADMNTSAGNAG